MQDAKGKHLEADENHSAQKAPTTSHAPEAKLIPMSHAPGAKLISDAGCMSAADSGESAPDAPAPDSADTLPPDAFAKQAAHRNATFVALAFLVLALVIINVGGGMLGAWQLPKSSQLEGRDYIDMSKVSNLHSIRKGYFQSAADSFCADYVPARDDVLLANAELQRSIIKTARLPFGYDMYPSFYQSDRVICENLKAIYPLPLKKTEYDDDYWRRISDALEALVANTDADINWRLALAERAEMTVSAPTHDLVANSADYYYMQEMLSKSVPSQFELVDLHIGDALEYARLYYRTDHHMQVLGSIDAIGRIMKSLGREPFDFGEGYVAFDGQSFGSNARVALCDYYWDNITDVDCPHSNLKITCNGNKADYHGIDRLWYDDGSSYRKKSRFASVSFHNKHYKLIEFENGNQPESAGTLLLIGDSYTDNCGRLFAQHYHTTYELDPRYYDGSLKEFINSHDIDDVVIFSSTEALDYESAQACFAS